MNHHCPFPHKYRHPTRAKANKVRRKTGRNLHAYRCGNHWHLGSNTTKRSTVEVALGEILRYGRKRPHE